MPIRKPASFGTGVSVQLDRVVHGISTASGRGTLAGRDTVSLTLRLRNSSQRNVRVNAVQVAATYGPAKTPAIPASGKGTVNFHGTLASGASTIGVYQFLVPRAAQNDIDLTVWYQSDTPTVLLRGSVR
ncbi:hypothetical protein [uncultured Jatrophihabitans sp.]|uniref:hypothetical protein n=1 Tax=uncultured Jatrophihabitans sp. TaxID=1610747 RepID=UPI0035CBBA0F